MGFFDRLFGSRAEAAEETRFSGEKMVVKAPIDGIVLPLEQLPDETFAAAILGPGCGIEPTGDTVFAPFDGRVVSVASTLHAIGLESDEGIELLIHIGIDTIALRGNGFTPLVREGQAVKAGTPLLNVDLDAIRAAGIWMPVDVGIMPILDQAATINMALSRNGCVMPRELCEIISKNWIFPNPFDKEPFDANVAEKKASFKEAGIEYTIRQIDEYRACGINGIHLYALNKFDDVARIAREAGLLDLI